MTVTLVDEDGNTVTTTSTNSDGEYEFENILSGNYQVLATDVNAPSGLGDLSFDVTIDCADYLEADFAFTTIPQMNIVTGIVFSDNNENGLQNAGEAGIAGVLISIVDANGTVVATTTTNNLGEYVVVELPDGSYTVEVGAGPDGTLLTTEEAVNLSLIHI